MSGQDRVEINLPKGFNKAKHADAVLKAVRDRYGEGFHIKEWRLDKGKAIAVREAAVGVVVDDAEQKSSTEKSVRLPAGTKPSDGDKVATVMAEKHPGLHLVEFQPYLLKATLDKLTDDELNARGALSEVLRVKPWEVKVKAVRGGGFKVELPKSYNPANHDEKINDVVTTRIGSFGWYTEIDARNLRMRIIPSEPPTFPMLIPYPVDRVPPKYSLKNTEWAKIPMGMRLPAPGEEVGDPFFIDVTDAAHLQVAGISGGGKSNALNTWVTGVLAIGAELVIVDTYDKRVDFLWCKEYCRPGGWGCESLDDSVAVLGLVLDEMKRRSDLLTKHGGLKWLDLPESMKEEVPLIAIVCDELTGIFALEDVPKGSMDAIKRMKEEADLVNYKKQRIKKFISKILAEGRFVGISLVASTQVASATTGIGPAMRTNLQNKMLCGANPTEQQLGMVFSDPSAVPRVAQNIQSSKTSKGVGLAHPEGQAPCVYKTFYAKIKDLKAHLKKLGVKTCANPEPTAAQVRRHLNLDEDMEDEPVPKGRSGSKSPLSGKSAEQILTEMGDDVGLASLHNSASGKSSYEKANAAKNLAAGGGKTRKQKSEDAEGVPSVSDTESMQAARCESCGKGWVHPKTGVCNRCGAGH